VSESRTSRRFPVHLPLKVLGEQGTPVGQTENISAAGVYLWLDGEMAIGSPAEFEILIPGEVIGSNEGVRLHCHARVVRCDTDRKDGRSGVACVIEQYEILRAGQSAEAGGE
jgi:PilZ domain